ncbi:MAG: hypothetical protein N4A65_15995 [Cohaesibacter sp.]|jgi:TATA-binding protein-associated factor Taf7|nr:hypothetical protein [Cohaesibacter sp.]
MDLSVQKMLPPASVQGKSAAKKTNNGALSDDAVETAAEDQKIRFTHGNTGYDSSDPDEQSSHDPQEERRQNRRRQRQLLSGEDLSELTSTMADPAHKPQSADGLLNLRAYQPLKRSDKDDDTVHFERNI